MNMKQGGKTNARSLLTEILSITDTDLTSKALNACVRTFKIKFKLSESVS